MSCVEPVVTSHLEILFWYVLNKQRNEIHYRNRFFYVRVVFVLVIMESYIFSVIGINAGSGNYRATKVAADIFYNDISITEIRFCVDIKTVLIFFVNGGFCFLKRRTNSVFQFIQESSLEGLAKIGVVKVLNHSPEAVIGETAFGKKAMDVRIPLKRSAEGVKNTNEARNKIFTFVHFMEYSENDTAYCLKKAVKPRTILKKERTKIFINGKDKMSVGTVNEFKGHFSRAVNAVFVTAGRAKFRMAAERNEFKFAAVGTAIHGTTIRRVTTIDHFFHVFHNNRTWMKCIFNFFIVFSKNLLKDVHKSIMKELWTESNPTPQD